MGIHLSFQIKSEESLQNLECFLHEVLGNSMIFDIEKASSTAGCMDVQSNCLAL